MWRVAGRRRVRPEGCDALGPRVREDDGWGRTRRPPAWLASVVRRCFHITGRVALSAAMPAVLHDPAIAGYRPSPGDGLLPPEFGGWP